MWKDVQNIELQVRYVKEPDFPLQLRMLTTLVFRLPQDVIQGFAAVCNERRNFGDVAEGLLAYFEHTYIDRFFLDTPIGNLMFSIIAWKAGTGASKEN